MVNVKEVSRDDAEKIWSGHCPICSGKLLARRGAGVSVNVMCENGCQKYNVPLKPLLPQRI